MILHMRAHFTLWEPFMGPSLRAVRTLVISPLQGYGDTASLSYPDTWVRKPDRLQFPYIDSPNIVERYLRQNNVNI